MPKLYRKSFTATLPDGSKKQLQYYGRTEKEAAQKRDRARAEYEAGLLVLGPKSTVAKYAELVEQELKDPSDVSRLHRLLTSRIGYLHLDEVRAAHIRAIYRELDGQSSSSISKGCAVIRRFFRQAVADGLLVRDPTLNVPRPTARTTPGHRAMTEEEERLFLELLRERVTDGVHGYDIAFGLMYACGLRPGEVRALQRGDLHLGADPHVSISRACKGQTTEIGPPKTAAGVRDVPIPAWFVPLLESGVAKDSLWIAPGQQGRCQTAQNLKRRWAWFYRALHLKAGAEAKRGRILVSPLRQDLSPYCIRHTYCTNLAYAGVPEVVAMRWMGHDDPDMVRKVYADASSTKLLRRSVQLLNAAEDGR